MPPMHPGADSGIPQARRKNAAPRQRRAPWTLLGALAAVGAGVTALLPRVPQPQSYHRFADRRRVLGIPHGLNVLSNLPLLAVGALGVARVLRAREGAFLERGERPAYLAFFGSLGLTGVGSAYYHLAPDDDRLVCDRLPLGAALMALTAGVLGDRSGARASQRALPPLLASGIASTLYWRATEARGRGDLRPYGLTQGYATLAIPALLLARPPRYTQGKEIVNAMALFGAAKVCEALDGFLYRRLRRTLSGHTLKHLLAAEAARRVLLMLERRAPRG